MRLRALPTRVALPLLAALASQSTRVAHGEDDDPPADLVLRVVDAGDKPLAGVHCIADRTSTITDARGEARFVRPAEVPLDVSCPTLDLDEQIVLQDDVTVVRVRDAIPVVVRYVDAWDHRLLGAEATTWTSGRALVYDPRPTAKWPDHVDPVYDTVRACRGTKSVLLVVPVERRLRLQVSVRGADGAPAAGARVRARVADGRPEDVTADADGRIPATSWTRLPWIPGDQVVVAAESVRGGSTGKARVPLGAKSSEVEAIVVLTNQGSSLDDEIAAERSDTWVGLGVGGDGESDAPRARLRVLVRRRDGRPVGDASVAAGPAALDGRFTYESTDAEGVASFASVPAGKLVVWLLEPGLVPTSVGVTLVPEEKREIVLEEAPARSLLVRVVDGQGRPVPSARIEVPGLGPGRGFAPPGWEYVLVVSSVHHTPIVTDITGTVRLEGLPARVSRVVARRGGRSGVAEPGDESEVTIRLE